MISAVLMALLAQAILLAGGAGMWRLLTGCTRHGIRTGLAYAWGLGVVVLYVVGGAAVRVGGLSGRWHYLVAAVCLALGLLALIPGGRARTGAAVPAESARPSWRWYEWLVLALILLRAGTVLYVLLVNPLLDSDAVDPLRWVGLAKVIAWAGTLPTGITPADRLGPSLLPAWTAMFLPRWHDGLVMLPWFMTYISATGVVYTACRSLTRHRTASLVAAWFFASLPLACVHVMRPGFADLIVCYFFLIAAASVARLFASAGDDLALTLVALVAAAGCVMTKKEGIVWAVWIIAVLGSYGVHLRWSIRWRWMLVGQLALVAALFVAYQVGMGWVRMNVEMDRRAALLFVRGFEPGAVTGFLDTALGMASFNLWWWFVVLMFVGVCIKPTPSDGKALTLYIGALLAGLFYFACFTGNAELTVVRTNVGRFLLQLAGVFVPLYAMFIRHVVLRPSGRPGLSA